MACLRGSKSKVSLEKGLDKVSTYGIMKNKSSKYIKDLIGTLIADGFIRVSGGTYPVLKLTEKSKDVLFDETQIYVNKLTEDPVKEKHPSVISSDDYDDGLFNHLKKVRLDLSKKRNVPPFIIFSDASLKDMATYKPTTEESFLKIKGVGDKKLMQYGDIFIDEIRTYIK